MRTALLSPITLVGRAFTGVLNQVTRLLRSMFSLKSLLLGGGILALLRAGVSSVADSGATQFSPSFSKDERQRINAVQSSLSRLGATLQSLFGKNLANASKEITGFLDAISNWLTENQDQVVTFLRDVLNFLKQIPLFVRMVAAGFRNMFDEKTLSTMGKIGTGIFKVLLDGVKALGDAFSRGMDAQRQAEALEGWSEIVKKVGGVLKPVIVDVDAYQRAVMDVERAEDALAKTRAGTKFGGAGSVMDVFIKPGTPEQINAAAIALGKARLVLAEFKLPSDFTNTDKFDQWLTALRALGGKYVEAATQAQAAFDAAVALANATGNETGSVAAGFEAATKAVGTFLTTLQKVKPALAEVKNYLVQFSDIASAMADSFTEAVIGFADRTKGLLESIKSLVSSLLSALGRLFIQAAFLRIFGTLLGIPQTPISGLAGIQGRQSGGPVQRGRPYWVGEHGRELFTPGESGKIDRHGAGGGGQVTVVNNFYGQQNQKAVEAGILSALERLPAFRKRLRTA